MSFAPGTSALPPPARVCMRPLRNTMAVDANAVADCVLASFDQLEDKRKPRPRNDGTREWVPLAGIVLSKGMPCRIREVQKWLTLQGLVKTASFLASP
jgi:hypothetical protein